MIMLRRRTINRQAATLQTIAAALRWLEAALSPALSGKVPDDFESHDAKILLEGLGLTATRSHDLALLSRQRKITDGMSQADIVDLQAQQLTTLAAELMWYDAAVRSALAGTGVREATHHDATELLEAMGL